MGKISSFDLISGADIAYEDICILRSPTLESIRFIGYNQYIEYLNLIFINKETYLEKLGMKEQFEQLDAEAQSKLSLFDLLVLNSTVRAMLQEALSFFIVETVKFDAGYNCFFLYPDCSSKPESVIDNSNFEDIKYGISQINYLVSEEPKPKKFRNSQAREIYEKILKGKKEIAKRNKSDENMNLPNLIGAVSCHHGSYNFTNIWSLTVYQLYDQFFRLYSKIQIFIFGFRWAAWGKEDFDFKVWFKDPNNK